MADLISRAYVLAEYDRQHQGPPGGARKIMEEAPAVDAVPVEWLLRRRDTYMNTITAGNLRVVAEIDHLMREWQKEQEGYHEDY